MTEQVKATGVYAMPKDMKLHELLDSDIIQLYMRKHNVQRAHIEELIRHVSQIRQIKPH